MREAPLRPPGTLPVDRALATVGGTFFFGVRGAAAFREAAPEVAAEADDFFVVCDARVVGFDFRTALEAPAVAAGAIWSSSPPRLTSGAPKSDGGRR